ncbi:MAG: formylglycine-generating enzyme family protein [Nitrospinota bacterium]|nr:formylglycine-generating enzyme family protein [Nitrospinota bacterium]
MKSSLGAGGLAGWPVLICAFSLLAVAGDNPAVAQSVFGGAPEGMVLVPEGEFVMGASAEETHSLKEQYASNRLYKDYNFKWEEPKRKVFLKAYYIDRTEVTNREYLRYIKATGAAPPMHWENGSYMKGLDDFPVLYVTQADAEKYAKWAGKRLPTEQEWEKASRGAEGSIFPWGDQFDPEKAATADSDLKLMGHALCNASAANQTGHAEGDKSPYGAMDMGGNVREWTASFDPEHPAMKVVKGGSWLDLNLLARGSHREFVYKYFKSHVIGFRCVKDAD